MGNIFVQLAMGLLALRFIYFCGFSIAERRYKKRCSSYIARGNRCMYLMKDGNEADTCLSSFKKKGFVNGVCSREKCGGFCVNHLPDFSSQFDNHITYKIIKTFMDFTPEIVAALLVLNEIFGKTTTGG